MKLSDFEKVGTLMKERDYLFSLRTQACEGVRMKFGPQDVRPDLQGRILPGVMSVLGKEIERVEGDLAALGVSAE